MAKWRLPATAPLRVNGFPALAGFATHSARFEILGAKKKAEERDRSRMSLGLFYTWAPHRLITCGWRVSLWLAYPPSWVARRTREL